MSLTSEQFSDAWSAASAAAVPPSISCDLHKLAGKEGDVVDVCVTVKAAEQHDFRSRCAFIFLIDNRYCAATAVVAHPTRCSAIAFYSCCTIKTQFPDGKRIK